MTIDEKSELVENYQDIILYAVNKGEERQRYLERKFPQGIKSYIESKNELFVNDIFDAYGVTDVHILKKVQFVNFMKGYTALEYLLLSEEEVSMYQQYYEEYVKKKSWEEGQKKYAKIFRELRNNYLKNWGAYKYNIELETIDRKGNYIKGEYWIWQLFFKSFCLEEDLDYSLLPSMKNQYTRLDITVKMQGRFKSYVYDEIVNYITVLQAELQDNIYFVLGNSGLDDCRLIEKFNEFHFNTLKKILFERGISKKEYFLSENDLNSICETSTTKLSLGKLFIVIEVITTNSHLKQLCSSIRNTVNNSPQIAYISLMKGYDRDEMISIINLKKEKLEKERKKREEVRKTEIEILKKQFEDEEKVRQDEAERIRIETEYQIQAQIEEEERIEKEAAERARLEFEAQYGIKRSVPSHSFKTDDYKKIYSCVSHWNTLAGTLKYFYLYNYYPYKLDKEYGFQPTVRERNVRNLIWNFKNNKEKGITDFQHQKALDFILPLIEKMLYNTFGNSLSNITLVCIPASTKKMNEDRYKEFSYTLCNALGMINAYDYIKIVRDREARHERGIDTQAEILFDESFFQNKNILIFDDVITRGDSMIKFYGKMTRLGANVICGFAIGKTKYERIDDDPITSIQNSNNW
ncbi:phosphoribosyltransferase [Bacteroides salyersiae]|uniref:phosphoribosyltransferase n=1 Tax=Bacteroides salyersiae TaxID=291644 RepID=UPI001CCB593A|nr:phosphoribosyltransferase [Bacteroides salyersiae]UBD66579.1 phosphoribosyltransferase [Bacteroides salyersiae]